MRNRWQKIISFLVLTTFLLGNASVAYAAIELRYVDAWQALNSSTTFYNKSVAQLIYDESNEHNINPRLILTLLQRESSAITQTTPSSTTRLAWPLFYMYNEDMADCLRGNESKCADTGWPSGGSPDYRQRAYDFGGVGQQIAYASYNFRNKINQYASSYSNPVSIDGQTITSANVSTRVLYAYTPHICSYNDSTNSICKDTDDYDNDGDREEIVTSSFYNYWTSWWGGTPNGGAYDQNNIISDANFSYNAMSVQEIQTFLQTHGQGGAASWLAGYTIPEYVSVAYPAIYTPPPPARKSGDANGDNAVESTDLSILADQWGKNVAANTGADFNGDGVVDSTDLSILADGWGK